MKKIFQQFERIDIEVDKFIDKDEEADNNCYLTDKEIIDIVTERELEEIEEMSSREYQRENHQIIEGGNQIS